MAKIKFKNFGSKKYLVRVDKTGNGQWCVQCTESLSETEPFTSLDIYKRLKRIWRKNKEKFDEQCQSMEFRNLFNYGRIK